MRRQLSLKIVEQRRYVKCIAISLHWEAVLNALHWLPLSLSLPHFLLESIALNSVLKICGNYNSSKFNGTTPRVLQLNRRLQLNFIGYGTFCNTNIDIDTKHKVAIFVRSYSKELFE